MLNAKQVGQLWQRAAVGEPPMVQTCTFSPQRALLDTELEILVVRVMVRSLARGVSIGLVAGVLALSFAALVEEPGVADPEPLTAASFSLDCAGTRLAQSEGLWAAPSALPDEAEPPEVVLGDFVRTTGVQLATFNITSQTSPAERPGFPGTTWFALERNGDVLIVLEAVPTSPRTWVLGEYLACAEVMG